MWPRSASRPSETSVIAVAPRVGGDPALPVGRLRNQMPATQRRRSRRISLCHKCISGSRPAEVAGDGHRVTGPRAAAQHRRAAAQVAERRHRDHPLRGADQVAADDARRRAAGLVPHAVGEFERLRGRRCPPARRTPTTNAVARPPIASMSAAFCAIALRPTSCGDGPVQPEVTALDQHVGGHHGPAVGGGHHRGVVAGADGDDRRLVAAGAPAGR